MTQTNNTGFTQESLRLLGAALALQQATSTAANLIPIPNTGRFITIGTPAEVARLLEIAPAVPASIGVLDTLDAVTGDDIAGIEAFKVERFYLADDVDGLLRRAARPAGATVAQQSPETRMDVGFEASARPKVEKPAATGVVPWEARLRLCPSEQDIRAAIQAEIADLRTQLACERQAKQYEQRHAVESEKALAQAHAELTAARQVGKHLYDAVSDAAPQASAAPAEQDHSEGGHHD